jgi:hypothetical protein
VLVEDSGDRKMIYKGFKFTLYEYWILMHGFGNEHGELLDRELVSQPNYVVLAYFS